MQKWDIASQTGRCSVSGRELAEGEPFYTVLFDRGDHFERADYSLQCWQGPPAGAYCFWKSRVPQRRKKRRLLVDDEVLIEFFSRLAGDGEPAKQQFRFVLALILMRKRLLKYEQTIRRGQDEIWQMRLKGQDRPQYVVNPQLDEDQIARLSQQLGAVLRADAGGPVGQSDQEPAH
ncbi:MAG: hypothetical protein ACE5K7_05420 [Phycisphaerae bacterium]